MSTRSFFIMFASITSAPVAVIESLNDKIAYIPKHQTRKRKTRPPSTGTTLISISSSDMAVTDDQKILPRSPRLPTLSMPTRFWTMPTNP